MKTVILVEGSGKRDFEEMVNLLKNRDVYFIRTRECDENHEFILLNYILSHSSKEIMLVDFSGREGIIRELGGLFSEMIFSLSYNKNSRYYTECPMETFLKLLELFEQGD